MTDRELLEAAAKAAGRRIKGWNTQHGEAVAVLDDDTFWQPLLENDITDCMGDALRLAVRLRITAHIDGSMTEAEAATQVEGGFFAEPHIDDPCAATRRAIVRAAAAIGSTKP